MFQRFNNRNFIMMLVILLQRFNNRNFISMIVILLQSGRYVPLGNGTVVITMVRDSLQNFRDVVQMKE
jgi:hypothetical protein